MTFFCIFGVINETIFFNDTEGELKVQGNEIAPTVKGGLEYGAIAVFIAFLVCAFFVIGTKYYFTKLGKLPSQHNASKFTLVDATTSEIHEFDSDKNEGRTNVRIVSFGENITEKEGEGETAHSGTNVVDEADSCVRTMEHGEGACEIESDEESLSKRKPGPPKKANW